MNTQSWLDKAKLLAKEAATKMTTYVALLVVSAGELRDQWQQLTALLPDWSWVHTLEQHAFAALGVLMIIARLRRIFSTATATQPSQPQ